jgi:MFS family permease
MMGVLFLKKRKSHNHLLPKVDESSIKKLTWVIIMASLASAMVNTVWALYMESFISSPAIIAFFSAFLTIISFFSYFVFIPLMEKMNKAQIYSISLSVMGVCFVALSITRSIIPFVIIAFFLTLVTSLRLTSMGIILRDNSRPKNVSSNFGLIYSIAASAWIIGPLISGFFLTRYGFNIVFSFSAIAVFMAMIIFRKSRISDNNTKKRLDKNFFKNFKAFFSSSARIKCYILNGGSSFWLVLIYLFMPLYIVREGFPISWVGYFLFFIAIIPSFGEYLFGKLAGTIGYKKIFITGFLFLSICAIIAFFVQNPIIVMAIIIISTIGVSMTESTTDSYFLDITSQKDELRFFGPYNTAIDACDFISKIIPAVILLFLPFKSVFLIFGLLMLYIVYVAFTIKDHIENKKK